MSRPILSRFNDRYLGLVVLFVAGTLYSIQVSGNLTTTSEKGENYYCIGSDIRLAPTAVCDGIKACPLGDDEVYCDIASVQEPVCTSYLQAKVPCFDLKHCIDFDWFCDNELDCNEGEDEWLCVNQGDSYLQNVSGDLNIPLPPCPNHCMCSGMSVSCEEIEITKNVESNISTSIRFLYLKNVRAPIEPMTSSLLLNLSAFPYLVVIMAYSEDIFRLDNATFGGLRFLRKLDLQGNNIRDIEPGAFRNLSHLDYLNLSDNSITKVERGTFDGLLKLAFLDLTGNNITLLEPGAFRELHALRELDISSQPLNVLQQNVFWGLQNLANLQLSSNKISEIKGGAFLGLDSLESLVLYGNQISVLRSGTFTGLHNLQQLHLWNNNLTTIEAGAFAGLSNTTFLDLENNSIGILQRGTFRGLDNLDWLNIGGTPLHHIEEGAFFDVPKLTTLLMLGTNIASPTRAMFRGLGNLQSLSCDNHQLCCFFNYPMECHTPPGSFSSCDRLMPNGVLRFFIWFLGVSAVVGNVFVLTLRISNAGRKEGKVQTCLIANLAISDAIMGIYMLIIGGADIYFGQDYFLYADQWRTGVMCKFAGFLSIVSSEASVFMVTVISVDRFIAIAFPFTRCRLQTRSARVTSIMIWLVAVAIGFLATFLGDHIDGFYGMSDVCVGLPLKTKAINDTSLWKYDLEIMKYVYEERKSNSETPAWAFSIVIYLVLNLFCFLLVFVCYISIFVIVKKSRRKARRSKNLSNEIKVAAKMALIVGTDFACWVPIIVMGILSQSGSLTIPEKMYAWSVVFIIPINSSINPYLYTLSNIGDTCLKKRKPVGIRTVDTIRHTDAHTLTTSHAYLQGCDSPNSPAGVSITGVVGSSRL